MSFYLETEIMPNLEQQQLLDFILGNEFPWFLTVTTTNYKMFCHELMNRPDIENKNNNIKGRINSYIYQPMEDIFLKLCNKNNIEVNTIFRAAINNTTHYTKKYGDIHDDHYFPHKQFIWYLNDFTDAPTYLFDDEDNLVKTTNVGKNKIVIFDNQRHAQGFCAPNENRIAVVFTFN
jgi:hypothetical protein